MVSPAANPTVEPVFIVFYKIVHLSQAVKPSRQKRDNQVGSEKKKQEKNKIPYKALYLPSYAMRQSLRGYKIKWQQRIWKEQKKRK